MITGLMLLMAMLSVRSVTSHFPPGTCIKHCVAECTLSGIDVAICTKYCPVRCLSQQISTKQHYCNLGCMLNTCAEFTKDEKAMSDCVSKCNKTKCKINV
ncbi:Unknown protein [Striga hermonthica]|uniref:Thionin-like protein n=1 Tax=Striga hermonthica TaxID=68872 RepID=A0A9N7NVD4_STRHE|nr:Unknown protein [Striga hermonthica]